MKGGPPIGSSTSYGGSGGFASGPSVGDTLSTPAEPPKPTFNSSMRKPNKAMKLGGKSKDVEGFVDQLKKEGQHFASLDNSKIQTEVCSADQQMSSPETYPKILSVLQIHS